MLIVLLTLSMAFANSRFVADHAVQQSKYWGKFSHKAIGEKLQSIPREVLDYLIQDNKKNGWSNQPKAAQLTPDIKKDLMDALNSIPHDVLGRINPKLTGIFLVHDLGGSAYTDWVLGPDGNPAFGFVVLDISALDRTANAWATWKERSPFIFTKDEDLSVEIETPENDTRANALRYILLHEFGHIVSIGEPSITLWGDKRPDLVADFSLLSWKMQEGNWVHRFDDSLFRWKTFGYYAPPGKKISAEKSILLYRQLLQTNYPSLYAATNPYDDFAESFVSYVHVVKSKRPWKIRISKNQNRLEFKSCWDEPRCKEKRALLEKLLFH